MKRLLFALLLPALASAQQPQADPAMARMRDAMKKLVQRITEAESQMAAAQAAQIAAEAQAKELTTKLEAANKQIKDLSNEKAAEKADAEKKISTLEKQNEANGAKIAALTDALEKWKAGFEKARDVANAKEGERAEAAARVIEMERKVTEHERKNREMYRLGVEILDRYKKFGLGTALIAREPFVGSMRVKFENYVQDYGDKLSAQQIGAPTSVTADAAAPTNPQATSEKPQNKP